MCVNTTYAVYTKCVQFHCSFLQRFWGFVCMGRAPDIVNFLLLGAKLANSKFLTCQITVYNYCEARMLWLYWIVLICRAHYNVLQTTTHMMSCQWKGWEMGAKKEIHTCVMTTHTKQHASNGGWEGMSAAWTIAAATSLHSIIHNYNSCKIRYLIQCGHQPATSLVSPHVISSPPLSFRV